MTDVLVSGETLVDFLPDEPGSLATVESFSRRAGGAPANVAVALARLGVPPTFWTRIGDDQFGDFLAETLDRHGVPDDHVERDADAKTTLAFVSLGEDADREFSFYRHETADTRLRPGRFDERALADFDWVHVGGVALARGSARDATYDLAERARDAGTTVSFDPNARPELWTAFDFERSVREAFRLSDVVKATPEDLAEAGYDATGNPADLAAAVCEQGPHTALLTLGGEGALAYATPEAPWNAADEPLTVVRGGYEVDPVDTTGAGDAFTAGAIRALSGGASLTQAVDEANAVAALTTTARGAMTALPTTEELDEFRASEPDGRE